MKNINLKTLLITLVIYIVNTTQVLASKKPPMPRGSGGFDGGNVVGGPIDNYIIYAVILSVLFGVWLLNKKNTNNLTS